MWYVRKINPNDITDKTVIFRQDGKVKFFKDFRDAKQLAVTLGKEWSPTIEQYPENDPV